MQIRSPHFRMADRLADGRLTELIAEGRAAGLSYDDIARRLYADYGIEATRQTVANWASAIDATEAAS